MNVGGKLGQLVALDSVIGKFNIDNNDGIPTFTAGIAYQQEIEVKVKQGDENDEFQEFFRAGADTFANDTFETPQYLGTIRHFTADQPDVIRVIGMLNSHSDVNDDTDYYAVALMGG